MLMGKGTSEHDNTLGTEPYLLADLLWIQIIQQKLDDQILILIHEALALST